MNAVARQQLLMHRARLEDLPPLPACPTGYQLRDYRSGADDEALARLMGRAFGDATWTRERVRQAFVADATVHATIVIAAEDGLAATASVRLVPDQYRGSGYVHWVGTDPAHGGKRLGAIASLAVLHRFVGLGCRDAFLETDDHRIPALKTYLALGFQPVERGEGHAERWREIQARLAGTST
jgi:mycothiol synthase